MEKKHTEAVEQLFDIHNIVYNAKQIQSIETYIKMLLKWNNKINLISKNNTQEILNKHIVDSITLFNQIDHSRYKNIVDLGAGNGLPGIIIKIFHNDKKIVFIEQRKKKASFLKEIIDFLDFKDCEVFDKNSIYFDFSRINLLISKAFGDIEKIKKNIKIETLHGDVGIYRNHKIELFHIEQ